jgi:membrane protease YdiL (CAAX protease family)
MMAERVENQRLGWAPSKRRPYQYSLRMVGMFFILAFAITWGILIPTLAYVPEDRQTIYIIMAAFGPFLAAVITIWTNQGWPALYRWLIKLFRLRIPLVLYLAGAFLIPIAMGGLHYALYRILGGEPALSAAEPWYLYLFYLIPTALLTGGNEEPGWRGLALPALLERFHPVAAAIILGVIHSAWHLPLMNHYNTTIWWYLFNLIPLTFILNWFYMRSRGSVIPVMLLHAGTNVIEHFFPTPMVLLGGLADYMVLRGLIYWLMAIVLVVATRGWLGSKPKSE